MRLPVRRFVVALVLLLSCSARCPAQQPQKEKGRVARPWPDRAKVAVSLSYDDAIPVHHRVVAPLLDKHGLHGTFYLSISNLESPDAWKAVASPGHEQGNHSLFHPCRRDPSPAYAWLPEHYDLGSYTPGRFRDVGRSGRRENRCDGLMRASQRIAGLWALARITPFTNA
jgi:Polysaccharide deacetylase